MDWQTVLPIGVPILAALVALFIGLKRWNSARDANRIQLLGPRKEVYEAIRSFLADVVSRAATDSQRAQRFLMDSNDARNLFGKEGARLVSEAYRRAKQLQLFQYKRSQSPAVPHGQLEQLVEKETQTLEWFEKQLLELPKKLGKKLDLSKV